MRGVCGASVGMWVGWCGGWDGGGGGGEEGVRLGGGLVEERGMGGWGRRGE